MEKWARAAPYPQTQHTHIHNHIFKTFNTRRSCDRVCYVLSLNAFAKLYGWMETLGFQLHLNAIQRTQRTEKRLLALEVLTTSTRLYQAIKFIISHIAPNLVFIARTKFFSVISFYDQKKQKKKITKTNFSSHLVISCVCVCVHLRRNWISGLSMDTISIKL